MRMKTYRGEYQKEISFPLGGIGSGCIGLGGDGRFREWEIFNRPAKGKLNGFSHLAIKAEMDGRVVDARVMQGDLQPPYTGEIGDRPYQGFGFGPDRETMGGLPHFSKTVFRAAFPMAEVAFQDARFPGRVKLRAFNPLIPLREDDSSLPAAFLEIEIQNTKETPMDYTVALTLGSPFERAAGENLAVREQGHTALLIRRKDRQMDDLQYGELCAAADAPDAHVQRYWYRGRWYDSLKMFWEDFNASGPLPERVYEDGDIAQGWYANDTGTLAAKVTLGPGKKTCIRMVISWYFPNVHFYPDPSRTGTDGKKQWKNYYTVLYPSALAVAADALDRFGALRRDTEDFTRAFYGQSLPEEMIEAAGANLSTLKSPTVLRLEDGSFYGWEGVFCNEGSCEGSCTHVWNYAYALPFLFPHLERSMRTLDYTYNQDEFGGMRFRLQLPLGAPRSAFRPCCDGQFGGVVKTYRDWKISGDHDWLKKLWPAVKKSLEYAWSPDNEDMWDLDHDGVLEGRQHETLDMELFGPNAWLTGMYLAALKAGAEMADFLGEQDAAAEYRALLRRGSAWVDEHLFNGEYYFQKIDLGDKSILEKFHRRESRFFPSDDVIDVYWNEEKQEIKYQVGEGCGIDQALGQWHADLCGLGDILDADHVRSALRSIHRYNLKRDMREHVNPCRLFVMPDEQATMLCDWPEGRKRPVISAPYSEEAWTGLEYQAASHMVMRDMPDEALELVRAVRRRFDGRRRNPWNEYECGSNYARAMSSYALILAASGFVYDLGRELLGFVPHDPAQERCYFWSVGTGYGVYRQRDGHRALRVLGGQVVLSRFESDRPIRRASLRGRPIPIQTEGNSAGFASAVTLRAGETLVFE